MFITYMAIIIIVYEIAKTIEASKFMSIYEAIKYVGGSEGPDKKKLGMKTMSANPYLYTIVYSLEVAYSVFCFILLFTEFWMIGIGVFLLVGLKKLSSLFKISKRVVWYADSILTIVLLFTIILNPY